MCGEHLCCCRLVEDGVGSSPHVRGTPNHKEPVGRLLGIIPACAGNTIRQPPTKQSKRDHPRMCGEHSALKDTNSENRGSSPHVRGTHLVLRELVHGAGIIPACAGNTLTCSCSSRRLWDHPRMCGEHEVSPVSPQLIQGSSPHVRGTPDEPFQTQMVEGIIPACAGNTC